MAPPLERVFLASPSTGFANPILAAPWVFTGEDNLRVVILNSQPGIVVTLDGRFVEEKSPGTASPFTQAFVPTADRLPTTFDFPIGVGFLLNVSVSVTAGNPLVGQTYVMVQVIRGLRGATQVLGSLLGGHITARQHLAYPGSPIRSSTDGEPFVRALTGSVPAAGAELNETVPAGARWSLVSWLAGLVVTAAAGDRQAVLVHASSGLPRAESVAVSGVPPSGSANLSWAPGLPTIADVGGVHFTSGWLIDNRLLAGDTLKTSTRNLAAGDQWTAPFFVVREWLEAA